jgi:hypothetical protein
MTVPGSGVGSGNLGSPQQPQQRELETTAWTQVNKANLNILPDTLLVPFTQFGKDPKYQSNQSRNLEPPLQSMRLNTASDISIDNLWQDFFTVLLGGLPNNVSAALIEDLKSPLFEDRNPTLIALGYLLSTTAKVMAWLETVGERLAEESPLMEAGSPLALRTEYNQSLGAIAAEALIVEGASIYANSTNFLAQVGANDIYFDGLTGFLREMGNGFSALSSLTSDSASTLPDLQDRKAALANAMANVNLSYQRSALGNDLQILGSTLEALSLVTAATALKNGSPALLIGLDLALRGIETSESTLGIVGNSLGSFINALADGLLVGQLPNIDKGSQIFLRYLTTTAFVALISLTTLVATKGLGILPAMDEADKHDNHLFSLEIATLLAANANIFNHTFTTLAAACGANEKGQQEIADILSTAALMLVILSASNGNENDANSLAEALSHPLSKGLEVTGTFLSDGILVQGDMTAGLNAYVQQALAALQEGNLESFWSAFKAGLAQQNISLNGLQSDIQEVNRFADSLWNGILTGYTNQTNTITGIAQSA